MGFRIVRERPKRPSILVRFCPKCGARNKANAKFCQVCTTPLIDEWTDN